MMDQTPMDEAEVQQQVQVMASYLGGKLWRNNCGGFEDRTGRTVYFGLGNISKASSKQFKSSDLIGFTPVKITPDMVGKTLPVFTAIECKRPDWKPTNSLREAGQKKFIDVINNNNGIASFVNSIESFTQIIKSYIPR